MSEASENAREIAEEISRARNEMEELTFASRDFANEASIAAKAFFDNNIQVAETRKAFKDIAKTIQESSMSIEDIITGQKDISEVVKQQIKYEQNKKKLSSELSQALGGIKLSEKQIEEFKKGTLDIDTALLSQSSKIGKEQELLLKLYLEQFKALALQDEEMEEMGKRAKNIEGGMGRFGKGLKGLGGLLKKVGLDGLGKKMGLEEAVAEGRKLSASLTKGGKSAATMGTKLRVAGKMAGSMIKSLDKAFGPLALFLKLVSIMKEVDGAAGDFAKNQGISYQRTLQIREEMSEVAQSSNDILVSSKGLMETQARLNQLLGSNVVFNGELASDMTSIALRTKMSAESQELFAMESLRTGKSAKSILKDQQLTTLQQNKQRGLTMSMKAVQDAIGKSSKAIQMTFKGNVKELTNQVMAAKALGTTLDGVEKISGALLDFESSIAAELEAELLLGKDINLEKARQAALEGDMAKVADEVLKNKSIMNAFETKNVIAQEAAAKALGMSRNELASMVKEQQQLEAVRNAGFESMDDAQEKYNEMLESGLSKEQAASRIKDEDLLKQLESASLADRFAATMERVKEVFIELATPVLEFIDGLAKGEGFASRIANIVKGMLIAYAAIKAIQMTMNILNTIAIARETAKAAAMGAQAAAATTTNAMTTFGVGTVIAVTAAVAAIAALGAYMIMNDGMIGKDGGMIVSGPKGSIQLNKDDEIIAGTDLMGGGGKKERGGGARINAALISEIQTLIGVNRQILAKSSIIEMNGNKVGEGVSQAERAIQ